MGWTENKWGMLLGLQLKTLWQQTLVCSTNFTYEIMNRPPNYHHTAKDHRYYTRNLWKNVAKSLPAASATRAPITAATRACWGFERPLASASNTLKAMVAKLRQPARRQRGRSQVPVLDLRCRPFSLFHFWCAGCHGDRPNNCTRQRFFYPPRLPTTWTNQHSPHFRLLSLWTDMRCSE